MKTFLYALSLPLAAALLIPSHAAMAFRPRVDPVRAYLKHHDTNHNGVIDRDEFPGTSEEFDKWDRNKDGKLETYEVKAMLLHRLHHRHPKSSTTTVSNPTDPTTVKQ